MVRSMARLAMALTVGAATSGCREYVPDLVETPWAHLEVRYCTAAGATRTWRTDDPALLERLRGLFVHGKPAGLPFISTSYSNEVRLELASGQRWWLYYTADSGRVAFHDPDSRKQSFAVNVSQRFFAALNETLTAADGSGILLGGACRMTPAASGA